MARYHINPKTGNPGICRAKEQCPFGDASNHYDSKEEAHKAYEQSQQTFSNFMTKSNMPKQHAKARIIAVFESQKDALVLSPSIRKAMESAPIDARLITENGMTWTKSSLSQSLGHDVWKFSDGEYDKRYRLEPKRSYGGYQIAGIIKEHGARLEIL
jgi:hypothetical protein